MLVSDEMSNEEIKQKIKEDMLNLKTHLAGTGLLGIATALTMKAVDTAMINLLKAIIDQQNIMIRQNELILRSLRR